jgi:hypothetical protein
VGTSFIRDVGFAGVCRVEEAPPRRAYVRRDAHLPAATAVG